MLDPIAEMLTTIRNAQQAGKSEVVFRASKMKLAIANILEKEGFIKSVSHEEGEGGKSKIKAVLKYYKVSNIEKNPAISKFSRISREGKRIYVKNSELKSVKNKFGIAIISTSLGVMTGEDAKKKGLGGEYICEVW